MQENIFFLITSKKVFRKPKTEVCIYAGNAGFKGTVQTELSTHAMVGISTEPLTQLPKTQLFFQAANL